MDLDLAQVRAFVAVVDHRHFGRAAATLALSQQALSKRVARLEAQLGRLLVRGHGGVDLTERGRRFLPAARQLLEVADHAVIDARGAPAPPLRVDVWGEIHLPAQAIRSIARERPEIVIELSGRRDLGEALSALERHEIELAFGNVAGLERPLAPALSAELLMTDVLAAIVSADSDLAGRDHLTPADLTQRGMWMPMGGSSAELRAFVEEYARSIGATLSGHGVNLGLDALLDQVAGDPALIAPVAESWPLPADAGVRVVPLRPPPRYPWYGVWRAASDHPSLPAVLHALRARADRPARSL